MIRIFALALAVTLAGCTTSVTGSNEAGGMIHMKLGPDKRKRAFETAEAECAKYGKLARVTGHSEWDNTMRYECVGKQ